MTSTRLGQLFTAVLMMSLLIGGAAFVLAASTPTAKPEDAKTVTEQQEVYAVFDRPCVAALEPGLDYHIEARVNSNGDIIASTAVGIGPVIAKLKPGCQPRLEVRRKK